MDIVAVSRLQFALTAVFHFIFVPLTIGLALFVAITETLYVVTDNPHYKLLARFWGKLFTINFLLGVVTGLTMEFQFGTNWSRYAEFMGDIFGSPLAFEALMAFFLESTFVSVWAFGWNRLSKKAHAFAAWMIALGTHLSAVWIIVANGFMQHPVGYAVRGGRAELVDFGAVFSNGYAWHAYFHTILAGWAVGGFFVLGVCAYHVLRRQDVEAMKMSFRTAALLALIGTVGVAASGHFNGQNVVRYQPSKFAAMESLWETQSGVPSYLITIPDPANQKNRLELLPVPKLLSFLATDNVNAKLTGLNDIPADQRPPIGLVFWAFRAMVVLGTLLVIMAIAALVLDRRNSLLESPWFLRALIYCIPLPYVAIDLGWMVAEVGRQPWSVYGLMRTADSVSPVPVSNVVISLVAITALYLVLTGLDLYFLTRTARQGIAGLSEERRPRKSPARAAVAGH